MKEYVLSKGNMDNNTRIPFFKVLLGIFCALMAIGSAIMLIGQIVMPDSFHGNVVLSILFVLGFGYFALTCFSKKSNSTSNKVSSRFSKYKLYKWLLRIFVFIVVVVITSAISVMIDMPNAPAPGSSVPYHASTLSTTISFFGIVLACVLAYYCPIPKKWKDEIDSSNDSHVTFKNDNPVDSVSKPDKEEIVFDREKVDL